MTELSSLVVLVDLVGAVSLLVWGLGLVRSGMERAFGGRMRIFLALGTRNRALAFGIGLATTLVLQSSTATALMTAGYVGQGLIDLAMAHAIMLGADVGTSLVAQMLSLKLHWLSPLLVVAGVAALRTTGTNRGQGLGRAVLGIGLMLLALKLLGEATAPMRDSPAIAQFLSLLGGAPIFAMLAAALLAAVAASSLAVVLFVATLSGVIDPVLTIPFVAGANLGSALLPFLTAGQEREARRIGLGNLLMRSIGAVAVTLAAPLYAEDLVALAGGPRFAVDFHVAFNLVLAACFLPFVGTVAELVRHLLPATERAPDGPKHLDPTALASPPTALAAAARETLRVGDKVERMLETSLAALRTDDERLCARVSEMDDEVDKIQEAIKLFVAKLGQDRLDEAQDRLASDILSYAINLEHIGDIVTKNLNNLAKKKIAQRTPFSDEGFAEIERFYLSTIENLHLAQTVFMVRDSRLARKLVESKTEIRHMESTSTQAHLRRFQAGRPETVQSSSLHLDILRDLKRINAHLASVAYPILDEIGALRESRLRAE
jgi:phosphate:Na+ symporter